MHVVTIDTPAKRAGEHINRLVDQHDGDMLCLLSGGSALDIVEYLSDQQKSECRTIFMMGDERGSRDAHINNSLQLQTLYPNHYVTKNLILTVPEPGEALETFAKRMSTTLSDIISDLQNPRIIQVLGVGSDGHTAGILPLPKKTFASVYENQAIKVAPVYLEGRTIDSRASVTPNWILHEVDELIVYLVGAGKQMILESLIQEVKAIHERPAELIKQHPHSTVYTDQPIETP